MQKAISAIMGSTEYYTQQDTGYIKNKHEYSTWGNNTKAPTYNFDPEYRSTEPYYTGHPYDGSLNLYYAEARFYDPETGSWLSKDPAGIAGGMNLYQYCNSNPASYVDVTGEEAITLTTVAAILLILGGAYVIYEVTWGNPNFQSDMNRLADVLVDIFSVPNVGYFQQIECTKNDGGGEAQGTQEQDDDLKSSGVKYPGDDPKKSPGEGWEWRGPEDKGSWYNPQTGETLHPDLEHLEPEGSHWDYIPYKNSPQFRLIQMDN